MELKFVNGQLDESSQSLVDMFFSLFEPLEDKSHFLTDLKTGAIFIECHITSSKLVKNSTIDVSLDPENQSDYRANRDIVEDDNAYLRMKQDACEGRSFSNIVAEYSIDYDKEHPLKVIGGQHRYMAIKEAFEKYSVDSVHGLKVYFNLSMDQRLDVQLISNTNIDVSSDLLDRMYETKQGPELRDWCQNVGLLSELRDFADKKRANHITTRAARSFILSYFEGRKGDPTKFSLFNPQPIIVKTGVIDEQWEELRGKNIWKDELLIEAGKEYAKLVTIQYDYFVKQKGSSDYANKALNYAVISSWAYIAGLLTNNKERLRRHFSLANVTKTDPLNAEAVSRGRHKTDPANYRGLGTRTDAKERGRLCELFFLQAEKGEGITSALVEYAIKSYHAKLATIEAEEAKGKV